MSEVKHTPLPWDWDAGFIPPDGPERYAEIYATDEDREPVTIAEFNDSIPEGRANARLIVQAVNSYYELLEALRFYADPEAWNQPPVKTIAHELLGPAYENQASKVRSDRGRVARAAISKATMGAG